MFVILFPQAGFLDTVTSISSTYSSELVCWSNLHFQISTVTLTECLSSVYTSHTYLPEAPQAATVRIFLAGLHFCDFSQQVRLQRAPQLIQGLILMLGKTCNQTTTSLEKIRISGEEGNARTNLLKLMICFCVQESADNRS